MGESYFELEVLHDPAHTKEVYRFIYFRHPSIITLYIILGISAILSIINMCLGIDAEDIVLFATILGFLPLWALLCHVNIKRAEKQYQELSGGMIMQTRKELYHDGFVQVTNHGGKLTIPYSSIKCCYQTKNMFLLQSKAKMYYYFPKAAFVKGNPIYFIPFIASRGVKVKGGNKQ